jgi:uncharacterized protein
MKLQLIPGAGLQLFSGYGTGYIAVNGVRHDKCMVVTPQEIRPWAVGRFESLTAADFGFIAELKPEILILGTGALQRFPQPELARVLAGSGAGVEVMDTRAACRTYNILAAEGRKVVAAILLET